jgi:hypothetical protein
LLSGPGIVVAAVLVAAAGLATGCGGGARQDKGEASGAYRMRIVQASFPPRQGLASTVPLLITVRNTGTKTIPYVALTVDGFYYHATMPGQADPQRPVWIVNLGPSSGVTAYVNTWALGPLPAGRTKTFRWLVTAAKAGTHTLHYRAAAGLNGKARAVTAGNVPPEGVLTARVTQRPRISRVDPKTGAIITIGQ